MSHSRPGTPSNFPPTKKAKTSHHIDASDVFHPSLLDPANARVLHDVYSNSHPFKYAVIDRLLNDSLLVKAKDECINELSFTEKETDIYKVQQTGDLASLSYLNAEQLARLPGLLQLRDSLYSPQFRQFVRTVTGCGPLSGSKQDMSVNTYRQGCHLLNHDDVIGSRRVSYILYMPLPYGTKWDPAWGGALELYDTQPDPSSLPEPQSVPVKSIPPSWNQFVFFEVQPGKSFHSVEEVVVDYADGRQRLSISGWFHAAQEGEDGFDPEPAPELKSSLEQLTSTFTPLQPYADDGDQFMPSSSMSKADASTLSEYLNPVYLKASTIKSLAQRFVEESSLELHDFLSAPLAEQLEKGLRDADVSDALASHRTQPIPSHHAGEGADWIIAGPPHKRRHCILNTDAASLPPTPVAANVTPASQLRTIQDTLFTSLAFRSWLAAVTSLVPVKHTVQARRFRPGLDYTLATAEPDDARLDVVLGLTPPVPPPGGSKDKNDDETARNIWASGTWGGWECYMAPHEEDDDPAVYRSGSSKKGNGNMKNAEASHKDAKQDTAAEGDDSGDESDEDDSTLLTVQPGFNRLLLVLRDKGVMHFVKYVSASAQGSRWDVCGEYEVGMVEEDEDGGSEEEWQGVRS